MVFFEHATFCPAKLVCRWFPTLGRRSSTGTSRWRLIATHWRERHRLACGRDHFDILRLNMLLVVAIIVQNRDGSITMQGMDHTRVPCHISPILRRVESPFDTLAHGQLTDGSLQRRMSRSGGREWLFR